MEVTSVNKTKDSAYVSVDPPMNVGDFVSWLVEVYETTAEQKLTSESISIRFKTYKFGEYFGLYQDGRHLFSVAGPSVEGISDYTITKDEQATDSEFDKLVDALQKSSAK